VTVPTGTPRSRADAAAPGIGRDTLVVTVLNLASRLTGFARVLAVGAALGATSLGDAYQAANLVSNILFELLAGGILAAVLVPTFVGLIDSDRRGDANRLARALLVRVLAGLGVVVAVGVLAAPWIMELLTATVAEGDQRRLQVELGTFLLWFFLPQVLLYAVGAVTTALLQADRRFVAAAVAPIANNAVVIATMVAFRSVRDGSTSLPLRTGEAALLAIGTTAGVVAMTLTPWIAARRAGLLTRPGPGAALPVALGSLARKGAWAAGHLGANQVMVAVTVIVAAAVEGGVIAYQIAFTFFLLPHAVLAHPVATTLFPRLAADASAGRTDRVADELSRGLRLGTFLLVPASVGLAALAVPALQAARLGNLDAAGADLVAAALAAYAAGLLGYSSVFLLTRAAYALDDTRTPTLVLAASTALSAVVMLAGVGRIDGPGRLVALGLVHAAAQTVTALVLWQLVRARLGAAVPVLGAAGRAALSAGGAGLAAWWVAGAIGADQRPDALAALGAGGAVLVAGYLGLQRLLRAPELAVARGLRR
jgi:putative peptidoglycan lipid II flippase